MAEAANFIQTVARVACGTQQRAVEHRAVAGVCYISGDSGGDHGDREHGGDHDERARARRRWEASCGGRGGVEIPFDSELHVFRKLPRHLMDAEPGACGDACLCLSVVPSEC